ncbi:hypothetical protein B0H21DRAFT_705653 [Amylocystis lapponica]|nr:hypothetical protein B0H21DRAFT_705653 [Amylocystis lapponica]
MDSDAPPSPTKSLTPQRKHHKLLKDGSEVWSAEVEKLFVDGLHKYWQSPWATYSRGRSRWRNQFLVDHLKQNGIERSKKQVASHIQVLRNMWRGEPEFHLVAGGEELFQENGLLASPKSKSSTESPESSPPASLDPPESSYPSLSSSTSDFSALDFDLGLTPDAQIASTPTLDYIDSILDGALRAPDSVDDTYATITPSSARLHARAPVKLEPLPMDPALFSLPQNPSPFSELPDFVFPPQLGPPPNRVCNISLWADGMLPSTIDIDHLASGPLTPNTHTPFRVLLRMMLRCPPHNSLALPDTQGFHGALAFASQWAGIAKCHTKSWAGNTCVAHEVGLFDHLATPQPQPAPHVVAYLPDSPLSRCRWLDSIQIITQQIVVDNEVLAVLVYHLERAPPGARHAAELLGFQKYPWHALPSSASTPVSPAFSHGFPSGSAPVPPPPPHQPELFARPANYPDNSSALSCALSYNRGAAAYGGSPPATDLAHLF